MKLKLLAIVLVASITPLAGGSAIAALKPHMYCMATQNSDPLYPDATCQCNNGNITMSEDRLSWQCQDFGDTTWYSLTSPGCGIKVTAYPPPPYRDVNLKAACTTDASFAAMVDKCLNKQGNTADHNDIVCTPQGGRTHCKLQCYTQEE